MRLMRLNLRALLGNEAIQFLQQSTDIVHANDPLIVPQVATTCADVVVFIPLLKSLISKDAQSALTQKIVDADARRDRNIIGIGEVLNGYSKHFKPEKEAAGKLVLRLLDKHGKVADLTYNAETAAITEIVDEATTVNELRDAITLLDLTDWFIELKKSNDNFNTLYLSRVDEQSAQPQGNVVDTRKAATVACTKMMDKIQSAANLSDNGEYDVLITKLNELVGSYKDLLAHREATNKPKGGQQ